LERKLQFSSIGYCQLANNAAHQFAARHALVHYASGTVYTFIPKNACSTGRLSLAIANGCIGGPDDYNWIHSNNGTFTASLSELNRAEYAFVILRCPYARIASVYLDKIVGHTPAAWQLLDVLMRDRDLNDISFDSFVRLLQRPGVRNSNIHWKPQVSFLVYQEYDDYFNLTELDAAAEVIRAKCGLELVDARSLTRHGLDQVEFGVFENAHLMSPVDLLYAKSRGALPRPEDLYTEELIGLVRSAYSEDVELIARLFGKDALMFGEE